MTPKKILVATDFSSASQRAVERAALLAQRYGAQLQLVHAVPPLSWLEGLIESRDVWSEQVRARAASTLREQAAQLAEQTGIEVGTALLSGKASATINKAIAQFDPDLVVVGAFGEGRSRTGQHGLGQTAAKLVASCNVPLLLVRQAGTGPTNVLAAVDLQPVTVRVARWTNGLAAKSKAWYLHVFELPFTPRLREYGVKRKTLDIYATDQQAACERALRGVLAQAGVSQRANKLVLRGEAIHIINRQLRKLKIDTLVIGKHSGRRRDAAVPYGSVCHYVTHFSPVDVLVIP